MSAWDKLYLWEDLRSLRLALNIKTKVSVSNSEFSRANENFSKLVGFRSFDLWNAVLEKQISTIVLEKLDVLLQTFSRFHHNDGTFSVTKNGFVNFIAFSDSCQDQKWYDYQVHYLCTHWYSSSNRRALLQMELSHEPKYKLLLNCGS